MSADGRIVMDTKELDRIMARLGINNEQMVRAIGFDVEGMAKRMAPIDTSALENSIYTKTSVVNGYGAAASAATSKRPDIQTEDAPEPPENTAYVCACVEYAEYMELGTSRTYGRPFMTPAAMAVSESYNNGSKWEGLIK